MTEQTTEPEDLGTVQWFGSPWGAPMNRAAARIDVPVGEPCLLQDGPIAAGDRGVRIPYASAEPSFAYYHWECFLEHLGLDGHRW